MLCVQPIDLLRKLALVGMLAIVERGSVVGAAYEFDDAPEWGHPQHT